MANTLGNYDPQFYAVQALLQLEKALGMASRVYRGYDKNPQEMGSVINLRRPTYFTAQAMPISSANTTDINTDSLSITLDQWYGTQFSLTDKELSYTLERIINEHIRPAASAVADQIDLSINQLARKVPWYFAAVNTGTATGVSDLPAVRRRLFDNQVPLNDVHLELSGEREQWFLSQDAFIRAMDDASGGDVQLRGTLGQRFGFEIFANQNVQAQQTGGSFTVAGGSLTVSSAITVGATTISLAASTCSGTILVGDIIEVGHTATTGLTGAARSATRNFVATANATVTSNAITVTVAPKASHTAASGTAAKVIVGDATKYDNLGFHRNFAALAMAPLPQINQMFGDRVGAMVASVADPITGLALRVTMWYEGLDAKLYCRIDALWGVRILDEDMAVRYVA